MSFSAEIERSYGKANVSEMKGLSYNEKDASEELGTMEENLLNMKTKFCSGEDDEYKIDTKKYINSELSYMNRISTFHMWTKKPLHLCSIVLARNGYKCEDENTIKCEICGCKYIYEKDKYSVYTQIYDLCLLHENNCPWKNKLMELSFFKLDEGSLKREELLKEYIANVKMLEEALYEVPLIDIRKTIKNLQIIIRRHLEKDDVSAKKYSIFNWYINFFKDQFSPIFSKNENVIKKGIEKIKKDYPDYENYIVDLNFISNLQFDVHNEQNYVNILCDDIPLLKDEEEDVDMYLKIVTQMRSRNYEEVNIFKLLALFGWTYKADSVDSNSNFTQILQCKYCFREVKISNFSSYFTRDKKLMLFKEICSAAEAKEVIRDVLEKKKRFQKNGKLWNERKNHNDESAKKIPFLNNSDGEWAGRIQEHLSSFLNGCSDIKVPSMKSFLNSKSTLFSKDSYNGYNTCVKFNTSNEQLSTQSEVEGIKKKVEKSNNEKEKVASKMTDMEEPIFKWKKKELILTKKNNDFFKDRLHSNTNDVMDSGNRKGSLFSKKNRSISKDFNLNRNQALFRKYENCQKEVVVKNSLSKVCLVVSTYLKDEALFMKALYNYYILTDSNFFKLDENNSFEENKKYIHNIRLFDVIENHRMYCPYITEDLYSFSKISKLFFELLISEFQRRYMFNK